MYSWGELPIIPDTESGIAAIEREQITKPRSVDVEAASLYSPPRPQIEVKPIKFAINQWNFHSLQLQIHSRKMKTALASGDYQKVEELGQIPALNEEPQEKFSPPPELPPPLVRQLLRKSVATIIAQCGFEVISGRNLDILTDVAHEHATKICNLLRVCADKQRFNQAFGFVDIVEQTLQESGTGGIRSLQIFHENLQQNYTRVLNSCIKMKERLSQTKNTEESSIKDDPLSPEIQFPEREESETSNGLMEMTVEDSMASEPGPLEELPAVTLPQLAEYAGDIKEEPGAKWPLTTHYSKGEKLELYVNLNL